MADTDRRTTIFGDQIKDSTITPQELKISNSPSKYMILIYNPDNEAFKWFHFIRGGILK